MGHFDRSPGGGRSVQGSGPQLPAPEELGGHGKGPADRRCSSVGTGAPREGVSNQAGRSQHSRERSHGGAQDSPKDQLPGQRRKDRQLSQLGRGRPQRRKGRWKEQRQEGRPERKGGWEGSQSKGHMREEGLRRGRSDEAEMAEGKGETRVRGVPGGEDSWKSRGRAMKEGGESMTFDTSMHEHRDEYRPYGIIPGGIYLIEKFSEVLGLAQDVLCNVRKGMRQQLTMAKEAMSPITDFLFPLPTSWEDPASLSAVVSGLNDLALGGSPNLPPCGRACDFRSEEKIGQLSGRFKIWEEPKPDISFSKLFQSRDVNYQGEEIKVVQKLSWKGVSASLPEGVGLLPLQDFCTHGTKDYVLNFERHLLPEDLVKVPRPPRVMVEEESWDDICEGPITKNL